MNRDELGKAVRVYSGDLIDEFASRAAGNPPSGKVSSAVEKLQTSLYEVFDELEAAKAEVVKLRKELATARAEVDVYEQWRKPVQEKK